MKIDMPELPSGVYRAEIRIDRDRNIIIVPTVEPAFSVPDYILSVRWRGAVYSLNRIVEMNAMPIADCGQHDPHPHNRAP